MNTDNHLNQQPPLVNPPSPRPSQTPPIQSAPEPEPEPKGKRKIARLVVICVLAAFVLGTITWLAYAYVVTRPALDGQQETAHTGAAQQQAQAEQVQVVDPTSGWVAYTNTAGKYSFKHPAAWTTEVEGDRDLCTAELTLLATSRENAGRCPSDGFGQMVFDSALGDRTADYALDYPSRVVEVDGVRGVRYEGEVASAGVGGVGPAVGTIEEVYVFYDGTRTYRAAYYHLPDAEDVSEEFGLLVGRTLKFHR